MLKNTIKRTAIAAGLVGAAAFTTVAPAHATQPAHIGNYAHFQGEVTGFTDNYLELNVNGQNKRFDLAKGTNWYGPMKLGAQASVHANKVDGGYVPSIVKAW